MRLEDFQLVDRVLSLSIADGRIRAEATVPVNSTILAGHFPGFPLVPGVLLVEAVAQTSGWLMIAAARFERMALLAQIKEAKLRHAVPPGGTLTIDAELVHEGSGFAVMRGAIVSAGKLACSAELMLRLMPVPNDAVAESLRDAAKRIGLLTGTPADG